MHLTWKPSSGAPTEAYEARAGHLLVEVYRSNYDAEETPRLKWGIRIDGRHRDYTGELEWAKEAAEQYPEIRNYLEMKEVIQALNDTRDGTACREEQELGNGPCGVCMPCVGKFRRDLNDRLTGISNKARTAIQTAPAGHLTALQEIRAELQDLTLRLATGQSP